MSPDPTLDLTCWFIDLQKNVEKTNSQPNGKSQWCHIFKNNGGSSLHLNISNFHNSVVFNNMLNKFKPVL
jgi:hypothetical protein